MWRRAPRRGRRSSSGERTEQEPSPVWPRRREGDRGRVYRFSRIKTPRTAAISSLPSVGLRDLTMLFGLYETLQETALLLLARDLQEEFEHGGALPRQISLKPANVVQALLPDTLGYDRCRRPRR